MDECDATKSAANKEVNGNHLKNKLGEKIELRKAPCEQLKSDTESIQLDNQVKEWIEDHQQQRDQRPRDPYRGTQVEALMSKIESNITKSKPVPPPIAPKPKPTTTTSMKPHNEITLSRNANEEFGFVIKSSPSSEGSVIGD